MKSAEEERVRSLRQVRDCKEELAVRASVYEILSCRLTDLAPIAPGFKARHA